MLRRYQALAGIVALGAALALTAPAASSDPPGPGIGPASCPADMNGDGFVDVQDFCMVVMNWDCQAEAPPLQGDCNGDLKVNTMDLVEVILAWGTCGL